MPVGFLTSFVVLGYLGWLFLPYFSYAHLTEFACQIAPARPTSLGVDHLLKILKDDDFMAFNADCSDAAGTRSSLIPSVSRYLLGDWTIS